MGVEPLGELKKLRGKAYSFKDFTLDARSGHLLKGIKGTSLEIIVEFENMNAHSYGIELLRSDDGKERTLVKYESLYKKLVSENSRGPFKLYHDDERPAYNQPADFSAPLVLRPDEKTLKMHIFLDRTVIEVFVNDRYSFTTVTGMKDLTNQGLKLFVAGGTVKVKSIDVWEMNSCYK
jgi:sucrose-6-phosphate hydrolase SacC (GH32 family)